MKSLMTIAFIILSFPAAATTYTILPDGTGDFPTIQDAVDAAVNGDDILLEPGTYTGDGNRDINTLGKAIHIHGGAGSPIQYILDCEGTEADPYRGFIFTSGEGHDTIIENLTVLNGYASGTYPNYEEYSGGGIYANNSSPHIINCIIRSCHSSTPSGNYGWGGGIGALHSAIKVSTTSVDMCTADSYGGGILFQFNNSQLGPPLVEFCNIAQNTALNGGGIGLTPCDAVITQTNFHDNQATGGSGGAAHIGNPCTPEFEHCSFLHNFALQSGGAVAATINASPVLTNCTIAANEQQTGNGAIYSYNSDITLSNCIIAYNSYQATVCYSPATIIAECCDVYGNPGGDYVDCLAGQEGIDGNISLDPFFCDLESQDITLAADSPCLPFTQPNPQCDLIGMRAQGCEPQSAPSLPNQQFFMAQQENSLFFTNPVQDNLRINIFDATGRHIQEATLQPGQSMTYSPKRSGIYLIRFQQGNNEATIKAAVMR